MEYIWIPIVLGSGFFVMMISIFYFGAKSKIRCV